MLRRVDGSVPEDLAFYRGRLDEIFGLFGEDRLVYGSDWPNSDNWGPYPTVLHIVHEYFTAKGRPDRREIFLEKLPESVPLEESARPTQARIRSGANYGLA